MIKYLDILKKIHIFVISIKRKEKIWIKNDSRLKTQKREHTGK